MPQPLDNNEIQKKCEEFLRQLGVPGFIVFGWQKDNEQYGVVSSFRKMPVKAAFKGLAWVLHDFSSKI